MTVVSLHRKKVSQVLWEVQDAYMEKTMTPTLQLSTS